MRYTKITKDVSWWYNERASISILACAAARLDHWVALEDFPTKKGQIAQEGDRREKQGRCDLWLSNHRRDYAIEFKQAWQPLGDRVSDFRRTQRAWKDAWDDCGHLLPYEAERRAAGVFVAPFVKGKARDIDQERLHERFRELQAWICGFKGIMAFASIYRFDLKICESKRGHIFPGVMVALRHRERSEKATTTGRRR